MRLTLAVWIAALGSSLVQEPDPAAVSKEQLLATAPAGVEIKSFSAAPDAGRVAFVAKLGAQQAVFVDGKEVARGSEIYPVHWSPDGKRWACILIEGDQQFAVVDGIRSEPQAQIGDILFSPDGRRLAYIGGSARNKRCAVLDGVAQKEYEGVESPAFSGDGKRLGYVARKGEDMVAVIDGVESSPARLITGLAFSDDGQHVAYAIWTSAGTVMVSDNRTSKTYREVGRPFFSPAGGRLAFEASEDGKRFLVVDGREGEGFETSSQHALSIAFSPDGRRVAWRVEPSGKDPLIFVDGVRQEALPGVVHFPMTFSRDGKRLAYVAREGSTFIAVVDGKPFRPEEVILSPVGFSPDGRRTVYVARDRDHRQFAVVDGKPGPKHSEVREPVFSPDGSRLVYVARDGAEFKLKAYNEAPLARPALPPAPNPASPPSPAGTADAAGDPLPQGFRARIGSARFFQLSYGVRGDLAFSPDGNLIALVFGNKNVVLWEVGTGKALRTLVGHESMVEAIAFSPDGHLVATGARDRTARIWDLESGRTLHILSGHSGDLTSVVFSPDSKRLLTAAHGPDPRLWDVATGQELFRLKRHGEYVPKVAFSPDGTTIYSQALLKESLFSWSAADGAAGKEISNATPPGAETRFSPRGHYVACLARSYSPQGGSRLRILDLAAGTEHAAFDVDAESGTNVAWSADAASLAIALPGGNVTIRERQSGTELCTLHTQRAQCLAFSPDGRMLATSSMGFIRLWDLATGREQSSRRHAGWVIATIYSPDGRTIATSGMDQTVKLWNRTTGQEIATLGEHASTLCSPGFVAAGKRLLTVDGARGIRVWDAASGKEERAIPVLLTSGAGPLAVNLLAVSPDATRAAVLGNDRGSWLLIVDLETGKTLLEGSAKGLWSERNVEAARAIVYTADGKTIVASGSHQTVVVWNAETARPLFKFDTGTRLLARAIPSPDGTRIVTGGEDGAVRSWDIATGKPAGVLQAHRNGVGALALSPDGRWLATAGWDRTLKIWDWKAGKEAAPAVAIPGLVHSMAFSPDGKELAAGGEDGTLLLKETPSPENR
jgi:WD40 repeat protein